MDDVTHAGHPCTPTRWCINDDCNRQALATQAAITEEDA